MHHVWLTAIYVRALGNLKVRHCCKGQQKIIGNCEGGQNFSFPRLFRVFHIAPYLLLGVLHISGIMYSAVEATIRVYGDHNVCLVFELCRGYH